MGWSEDDPTVVAVAEMIGRTGAETFGLRYQDDDEPVVWVGVATYSRGRAEVAAGLTPQAACWRLAEQVLDGGTCTHCERTVALLGPAEDGLTHGLGCEYRLRGQRIVPGCQPA